MLGPLRDEPVCKRGDLVAQACQGQAPGDVFRASCGPKLGTGVFGHTVAARLELRNHVPSQSRIFLGGDPSEHLPGLLFCLIVP